MQLKSAECDQVFYDVLLSEQTLMMDVIHPPSGLPLCQGMKELLQSHSIMRHCTFP